MQTRSLRRMLPVVLGLMLLSLSGFGCGSKKDQPRTVKGKVTYKGAPLANGRVQFFGADGKESPSAGIGEDGLYNMPNAPAGEVKIAVFGPTRSSDNTKSSKPLMEVDAKYTDPKSSGLKYTVVDGSQEHDIDVP